jgi:hypothetical protein
MVIYPEPSFWRFATISTGLDRRQTRQIEEFAIDFNKPKNTLCMQKMQVKADYLLDLLDLSQDTAPLTNVAPSEVTSPLTIPATPILPEVSLDVRVDEYNRTSCNAQQEYIIAYGLGIYYDVFTLQIMNAADNEDARPNKRARMRDSNISLKVSRKC